MSENETDFLLLLSAQREENEMETAENIKLALDFMLICNERLKAAT